MGELDRKALMNAKQIRVARKWSPLDGRARFSFENRDSPDYKPHYARAYTNRQMQILREEIPLEQVRLNELSFLANKAKAMGDMETHDFAMMLWSEKKYPNDYRSKLTLEESKKILQELTPWEIKW